MNVIEYGYAVWKGRKIHPKTDYYDLPWEKVNPIELEDSLAL